MAMSKSKSKAVHFSVLGVMVVAQCAVPSIMIYVGCASILVWVTACTILFMSKKEDNVNATPLLPTSAPEGGKPEVAPSSGAKKERLYYLDNLKIFLTVIVILHHQTCSFTGSGWYFNVGNYGSSFQAFGSTVLLQNQSYFMCAFFFISGYFTPSSFDKKGKFRFLRDKFKR